MTPEIELERHLNRRRGRLGSHENQRILGDAARQGNVERVRHALPEIHADQLPQIARQTYEGAIRQAEVYSSEKYRKRTWAVVVGWIQEGRINQETALWFLDQCDLGYAGEARIETVASGSRAKREIALDEDDRNRWLQHGLKAADKHQNWWDTLQRIHRTLHQTPCLWPIMIDTDRGVILRELGRLTEAEESFRQSFEEAKKIMETTEETDERLAAASDGGVARIRQAQVLEDFQRAGGDISEPTIYEIFKEGRNLVHWAGRQSKNFERSRVIELWYTKYCLKNQHYLFLPSIVITWLWLLKNHQDTRTMFKNYINQARERLKQRFTPSQYVQT